MFPRSRTRLLAAGVGLVVAATLGAPGAFGAAAGPHRAPLLRARSGSALHGRYIVVLKRDSRTTDRDTTQRRAIGSGGRVTTVYHSALNGFAAKLPPAALDAVRRDPDVAYVEADQRVQISGTESGAPWGLDRVDQRHRPLNGHYRFDQTGNGVTAYIIDTGIRKRHVQFGGRVTSGFTAIHDGHGTNDCNGHGTHVSGIVGSKKYGVAKAVTLTPVRVIRCGGQGADSGIIAGVDWVTSQHSPGEPAVANMSLGGPFSSAMDDAVENSIADGVTYAVAAGNSNSNACFFSPADVPDALTVGSSTRSDARSGFSNKGSCVDLFAPGSDITSTWNTSNTATRTLSGTSMASPHVAGAAVLFLQTDPTATPEQVGQATVDTATSGVLTGVGTSPNLLLYSRIAHAEGP